MKHIKARIEAWGWFFQRKVTFLEALSLMLPLSRRSLRTVTKRLFGRPFVFPNRDMANFIEFAEEIITKNQYHDELIRPESGVVDAGANLGVFSVLAASQHPDCTVYAFEPTPATFEYLKENAKWYPNIKIFNCALGETVKTSFIVAGSYSSGGNHIGEGGTPCEMKTIDSFGIPVDFLKIDTEGYEANILKGAAETIKKYKPIIAMSAYHKPEDKTELPKLLNSIAPYDCELRHDAEEDFICKPT